MSLLHRCFRILCFCALIMMLALISRQTMLHGGGAAHRIVGYFSLLQGNDTVLQMPNDSVSLSSLPTTLPTPTSGLPPAATAQSWRSGYEVANGSFRVNFPKLYFDLQLLKGPPKVVNVTVPRGAKACQRPKSQNLADELGVTKPVTPSPSTSSSVIWSPMDCWPPLSRTAVIVPYRNRSENLDKFVPYMWRLLQRQNILFGLFVVEQANTRLFNRAKLINIGFKVAQQFYPFDCFVFQDADKVPENVANVYDCANSPKLLISEMRDSDDASKKYRKGKLYTNFFGGAIAISKDAFLKVNGNSNRYYGWGREDDELAARLSLVGIGLRYNSGADSRFVNLRHSHDIVTNTMPWPYAHKVRQTMSADGLSSLNYTDRGIYAHGMFVLVRADV